MNVIELKRWMIIGTLGGICMLSNAKDLNVPAELEWPAPKVENRPGCYWWWMGSAVDKENITWNLETMRKAGMGGVTIVPIYGVKGYEEKYIQHLSPEFVAMVSYACKEARHLGMWVDMTTGTGWPFGGPMITEENCDATVVYKGGKLSQKFSGQNVKRAAPGGEGKTVNPFSAKAMAYYLKHFDEPFDRDGVVMPRAMYHDSFEFNGNWCRELPEEFRKRRGYDLMKHLPELFGKGDPETVARIKADYRETLSDLHLEYLKTWVAWSKSKGCTTRDQAHGSPSNLLDAYGLCGIPETETFGATRFKIPGIRRDADNVRQDFPQPLINRMASSAAHVTGKPLVASETCTWIRNHFRASLAQVKPEVDQLFLNGINHIFFHGTCYSPKDAPWPGWLFYASLEYNSRNAIWHDAPLLNAYITRCQSILQSGMPDNAVALYWPVYDIWHNSKGMQQKLTVHHPDWLTKSSCGKAATQLRSEGFGFDFISDRQLIAGESKAYKAIVVPETGHMPVDTLKQLLQLAASGQPVLFLDSLPADVPGFNKLEERRAVFKKLLQGQEKRVVNSAALKEALAKTAVVREPMVDQGLDFIRRRHDAGYHYFIANMGARVVDGWVPLGVPFSSVVIMDPRSGESGLATVKEGMIYLQLKPGETRILRTFDKKQVAGEKWPILEKSGESITVKGEWKIRFVDGGPVLPADITTRELKSWTEIGDEEAKRFAGTARYSIEVNIPEGADNWEIDLGDVRESARVFINGKEAAGLFSVPFSAPVGRYLKPGRNLLEIEVTNLSANRIRDLDIRKVSWKNYHDINFVDHNYKSFDASKWALTPSGLLGPVTLTPLKNNGNARSSAPGTGIADDFVLVKHKKMTTGTSKNMDGAKSDLVRNLEKIVYDPGFAAIPKKIFKAADYGVKADGKTVNTKAIQAAIDAAHKAGGGVVVLPQGITVSGALFLKSRVELRLDEGVVLQAVQDDAAYPDKWTRIAGIEMDWPAALINIYEQENVRITGKGIIDGNGKYWWNKFNSMRGPYTKKGLRWAVDYDAKRVRPLVVYKSKEIFLKDFTVKRAGFWTITFTYSDRVYADGITIRNNIGGHGPSTDGFDVDSSRHVMIENCDVDCNDDNFCIKAGRDSDGLRVNRPTENVVIRNCKTGRGHGLFTLGSETSGGMNNIEVYGLKAKGTSIGFRLKSAKIRGGVIRNIWIHDVEMDSVRQPFHWELNWMPSYSYPPRPKDIPESEWPAHWHVLLAKVDPPERGIPEFHDLRISNVKVTNADIGIYANAYPEKPIRNVTFENVSIETKSAGKLSNCKDWVMDNVTMKVKDGKPFSVNNCVNVELPARQ